MGAGERLQLAAWEKAERERLERAKAEREKIEREKVKREEVKREEVKRKEVKRKEVIDNLVKKFAKKRQLPSSHIVSGSLPSLGKRK